MSRYGQYGYGSKPSGRGGGRPNGASGSGGRDYQVVQPLSTDAEFYSRNSGRYGRHGSSSVNQQVPGGRRGHAAHAAAHGGTFAHRPPSRIKQSVKIVGVALLVVVLAVVAAFLLYMHQLNAAMSLGNEGHDAAGLLGDTVPGPYYTLIIGSDTRATEQYEVDADAEIGGERADVVMLARIDEQEKQVTLVSIPRDSPWVDDEGQLRRINESYYGGASSVVKAVEGISGVNVSHYVRVRFAGFESLVDTLGGVDVDVPMEISYTDALTGDDITVEEGEQTLNGAEALIFARARHEYTNGEPDQIRQNNVRELVEAIAEKVRKAPVTDLPGLLMEVAHYVGTDMSSYDFLRLGMAFRDDATFYGASAPFAGCVSDAADGAWLCYDDREGWDKVMSVVNDGGDPSTVSYVGDVAYVAGTDEMVIVE